jgi:HK97 family phage portal protein
MNFDLGRALRRQQEGKALVAHPAFMDRSTPVSIYSPGASRQDAVISQREAPTHMEAYGGKQAIDWVYDAIGLFADPAGTAPYHLEKADGTHLFEDKRKGTPPDHEEGPADLYRLLKAPNPFMLYDELMALLVVDLLLVGNGYWLKWRTTSDGRPLALYRLAPSHVRITPGPYGPKDYKYQPPGSPKPLLIDPTDIIHFRRPNPNNAYLGMGVIQGAGRSMDLELAITDTMASYYENKAEPSVIVQSDRRVPRDVFMKLRTQLRTRLSGSSRAGELLVLESGLKASTLSRSAAEALFAELSQMSQDRVYAKFRASRKLFGYLDSPGSDKVSDARREFDNYTLRPLLERLSRLISEQLTAAWDVQFKIDHRTLLPADEAVKVASEVAKLPGIKVRELRRQYAQFGIDESTGDPEIDEMVLNLPTLEADANGQVTLPSGLKVNASVVGADQPLAGEPGRPPKPGNTRAITAASASQAGAQATAGKALTLSEVEARLEALSIGGKALNASGESVSVGNRLPGEIRPGDPFSKARQTDIDTVTVSMAAALREAAVELERGLLDTVEGKALKTSDIVQRIKQSDAWGAFKTNVQKILEDGARQAAASGVMHSGRVPEDDIDYDGIVKSIVHRPDGLRSILRTIKQRVAAKVKEARDRDGERHDFEASIRAAITEWSDSQAVAIADSEATEAYNEATLTVLESVGEEVVYVHEEEDAPDDECIEARGQVWPIEKARQNRKQHPRCRRAFLSLAEAEVA